jgi:hypothetical protein
MLRPGIFGTFPKSQIYPPILGVYAAAFNEQCPLTFKALKNSYFHVEWDAKNMLTFYKKSY